MLTGAGVIIAITVAVMIGFAVYSILADRPRRDPDTNDTNDTDKQSQRPKGRHRPAPGRTTFTRGNTFPTSRNAA